MFIICHDGLVLVGSCCVRIERDSTASYSVSGVIICSTVFSSVLKYIDFGAAATDEVGCPRAFSAGGYAGGVNVSVMCSVLGSGVMVASIIVMDVSGSIVPDISGRVISGDSVGAMWVASDGCFAESAWECFRLPLVSFGNAVEVGADWISICGMYAEISLLFLLLAVCTAAMDVACFLVFDSFIAASYLCSSAVGTGRNCGIGADVSYSPSIGMSVEVGSLLVLSVVSIIADVKVDEFGSAVSVVWSGALSAIHLVVDSVGWVAFNFSDVFVVVAGIFSAVEVLASVYGVDSAAEKCKIFEVIRVAGCSFVCG